MAISIRPLRPDDIPALIDLASETFYDSFGDYHTSENCEIFIRQVHNEVVYTAALNDPKQLVLLAEDSAFLKAYLYAKPMSIRDQACPRGAHELSKIYTRKSMQGRGIGKKLLRQWEDWAAAAGYDDLVLGVWSENHAGQRFYRRHGYNKISEYELTVGTVVDIDYIFHKTISVVQ